MLRFSGDDIEADSKARKALQILKQEDGSFTRLWVKLPDGRQVQLYVGPDKNDKTVATEVSCKRLKDAVMSAHPSLDIHALKRDGVLCIGWEYAVRVIPHPDKSVELMWIRDVLDKFKLNKKLITDKFNALSSATGINLPWCP